jgi:protein-tyrosine phosphatase
MDEQILIIDFENTSELPKNFRTTRNGYQSEGRPPVTWSGLDQLNASAARQFSELDLITSLDQMSGQVCIVDLRQESHAFADGRPVSWYGLRNQSNAGKTDQQIADLEGSLVSEMASRGTIKLSGIVRKTSGRIEETSLQEIEVVRSETERELVERMGLKYVRFPVTDHQHPSGLTVDRFVDFVGSLPEDAWLHFHCRSGKGRSSTFMVLYDMFHNAGEVSLEDIICRNALMGSKDISKISNLQAKLWKNEMATKRHAFVAAFYSYMVDPAGYGRLRWTEWLAERGDVSLAR